MHVCTHVHSLKDLTTNTYKISDIHKCYMKFYIILLHLRSTGNVMLQIGCLRSPDVDGIKIFENDDQAAKQNYVF